MSGISDRYAGAVRATSLKSSNETMPSGADPVRTASKLDVIGAYGLMGKKHPLAAALARLLVGGDDRAVGDVVREIAAVAEGRAWRTDVEITRLEAEDMGRKVLAWYRNGRCKPCNGLGFELIAGAPSLSRNLCKACKGSTRIGFNQHFSMERLVLAQWVLAKLERELALGASAAMHRLAPSMAL